MATAIQTPSLPTGRRSKPGLASWLAASVTFLLVSLFMTAATLISAPTRGVRIADVGRYTTEVFRTSRAFALAGIVLGVIIGLFAARAVYQIWHDRQRRSDFITAYLFLLPYLLVTVVFTVGVLLFALYVAFFRYDIFTPPQFIGVDNFTRAFREREFLQSLVNVFWYSLIVTPTQTALALLLAVLLNQKIRGREFFRTIFYTPSVTSSVVISMIFWWLYLKTGFLNYAFETVLGLVGVKWQAVEWLNNPRGLFQLIVRAFGGDIPGSLWYLRGPSVTWMAIMFQNIFTTIPTFMIMFLAALQDIPASIYEAAEIDGANARQKLFRITIPMLRPVILLVVVLGTIGTLQIFDQVKILTAGGPLGTTLTPVYLVYREAIGTLGEIQFGYASAMAFILAVIIFSFTFVQRRFIERGTEQY
jgi:multiple sugar transport system permease protein